MSKTMQKRCEEGSTCHPKAKPRHPEARPKDLRTILRFAPNDVGTMKIFRAMTLLTHSSDQIALAMLVLTGCTFNFELTSQRTALENQIMGTYQELDEDAVVISDITATQANEKDQENLYARFKRASVDAKQNQEFNRDDIEDFKADQVLGETNDGRLVVLPKGVGLQEETPNDQLKYAQLLAHEENRDREMIWRKAASGQSRADALEVIKKEFIKLARSSAKPGHWLQDDQGKWVQKTEKNFR